MQAKQLHRPAARCYFGAGDTCVLVAVLHIRLIDPAGPGSSFDQAVSVLPRATSTAGA